MNTVTITFSTIGYELLEPMNTSLLRVEYTVTPLKIATSRARMRRPAAPRRTALELGSEIVEREIDVHELHGALAALLLSYHRQRRAERAKA
jgi:hypothetical protein